MKKERNEKSMNKRCIVMMLVMAVTINTATVFAQQTHTLDFITVLETPQKQNAIELTLEEATQKALTRSTTLKNNNMDLNISEQKLEDEENNIANGHTFQQLLQYIKQNADYASSKLSREVTEENVKFSLKQVYIDKEYSKYRKRITYYKNKIKIRIDFRAGTSKSVVKLSKSIRKCTTAANECTNCLSVIS